MAWYTWYTVVFPHTNSMFYANMIEKKTIKKLVAHSSSENTSNLLTL